jgi:hypothetical protein
MPNKGNKHICSNCEVRFFDFLKSVATCPKCGTVDQPNKGKGGKTPATAKNPDESLVKAAVIPDVPDDDEDDDLDIDLGLDDDTDDDDEEEDNLMEDTSDLGSDDDDVHEVLDFVKSPDSSDS